MVIGTPTSSSPRAVAAPCAECGAALSGGVCPACALGDLLGSSPAIPAPAGEGAEMNVEFGDYLLKRRLASGGMGVVYIAEHRRLRRTAALKMIRGATFAADADVARFTIEAEAAAALDHPHIVPIYEVGFVDEQPFFTMKLVDGQSLAARLHEAGGGGLGAAEAARILEPIARAVHHAHQRGVLHRDLKPGNILLDADGIPWLTDFGLAKVLDGDHRLTGSAAQLGTPHYMPPEAAGGSGSTSAAAVSTAGDVWALGVILWEMLFGEPPFRGARPVEILRKIESDPPTAARPLGSADRDLLTLAMRCLEKDPARRLASAGELADELARWSRGEPVRARPVTAGERLVKWVRRKPVWAALIAVLAAAGLSNAFLLTRANDAVETLTHTNDQLGQALTISTATKLALDARFQVAEDPARALLLAVEAAESTERLHAGVLPEAADALTEVLQKVSGRDISPEGPRMAAAESHINPSPAQEWPPLFSPDQKWVITLDHWPEQGHEILAALFPLHPAGGGADPGAPTRKWTMWKDLSAGNAAAWMPDSRHLLRVCACGCVTVTDLFGSRGGGEPEMIGDLAIDGMTLEVTRLLPEGGGFRGVAIYKKEILVEDPGSGEVRDLSRYFATRIAIGENASVSHGAPVFFLAGKNAWLRFSPDLRWMWVYGQNKSERGRMIDLANLDAGKIEPLELPGPAADVWHAAFSPDNRWFILRHGGGRVRLYDLEDGARAADLLTSDSLIESFAFSPDSRSVAVSGAMPEVYVCTLEPPAVRHTLRVSGGDALAVKFSPDGKWLAAGGSDRLVEAWPVERLASGPPPLPLQGLPTSVLALTFSPQTDTLIACGMGSTYRAWRFDGQSAGAIPDWGPGGRDAILDLALSPDRRWLATACDGDVAAPVGDDGTVKLASIASGDGPEVLGSHGTHCTDVAFSPDGRWLASSGADGLVQVWALGESGKPEQPGPTHVFTTADARLVYHRKLAIHPRGTLYCTTGDGVLFTWDLNQQYPERRGYPIHSIRYLLPDVQVSPDGRWLAVARHGGDAPSPRSPQYFDMVMLFDVSEPGPLGKPVAYLPARFIRESTCLAFSGDSRWLAAGGGASVWDLKAEDIAASRVLGQLSAQKLAGAAFAPDGRCLALGGTDGRLYFWDWRSDAPARMIDVGEPISAVSWLDNTRLLSGCESGAVKIWETSVPRLKALARRVAERGLTDAERRRFRIGRR